MKLISRAEVARICGVTRPTIGAAVTRGALRMVGEGPTGQIDITDSYNLPYINEHAEKAALAASATSTPLAASTPEPPEDLSDLNNLSMPSANRLKVIEAIKTSRQKRLESRKELVPRKLVQRTFGKLYTIDTNESMTLGDKLAADIAALCKISDPRIITKITEKYEREMYKVLAHKKRLINDFLDSIDAEQVDL